jgi:membrane-bound lytic murein transglycosylase D
MRQPTRSRCVVFLLFFSLILITASPLVAVAAQQPTSPPQTVDEIIKQAEDAFIQGVDAHSKGDLVQSRKMFDQAIDAVLLSNVSLRTNSRLDYYYRDLVDRIHKYEAQPGDQHEEEQRTEVVEPAVLDELSRLRESDLATVTPDGVRVFGKYDFDFSVAPPVFQFIDYFTSGRGRSTMETGLQRSGRFRQMAEKIFKEERVPLDLIWLAQAESVWKAKAVSRAAARGIWQFIPSTGLQYGLQQTQWVDDRSHFEKSTRAAARYLKFLHGHFAGDWLLAMAAYNSGENRVNNTIARCGYADFWEMYKRGLLPQETRNYVPIILAIMIVSKNQKRYGFDVKTDPPLKFDTYELPGQTDLKVVADILGLPYASIEDLNPELRRGVSPPGQTYNLRLPKGTKKQFELAYAALPEDQRVRKIIIPREEIARSRGPSYRTRSASYQIRRGDTLSSVARRTGVPLADLLKANGLSASGRLKPGQKIKIPKAAKASKGKVSKSKNRAARYSSKKVKSQKAKNQSKRSSKEKQVKAPKSKSRR